VDLFLHCLESFQNILSFEVRLHKIFEISSCFHLPFWGGFEQAGILHPLSKEKEKKLKLLLGEVFPSVILNIISHNILIFKFFLYFSFSLFNFFTENGSKDAVLKKVGEFLARAFAPCILR